MLTRSERYSLADQIIAAMRRDYEEHGEELADFEDGFRYLVEDASDEELRYEFEKFVDKP